nr:YolD-like family protein [Brevibacillus fulvus]
MKLHVHQETMQNRSEIKQLVQCPSIEEEDFGEMCFRIYDSTQYDYAINVKWFIPIVGNLGMVETAWGIVKEINIEQKRVKLVNDWSSQWIDIENLVHVTKTTFPQSEK